MQIVSCMNVKACFLEKKIKYIISLLTAEFAHTYPKG